MMYVTILTLKKESIRLELGSGQVLVGLLDFKSSDGQKCPWWVRFPCTSAKGFCHRTEPLWCFKRCDLRRLECSESECQNCSSFWSSFSSSSVLENFPRSARDSEKGSATSRKLPRRSQRRSTSQPRRWKRKKPKRP